jgi:ketol-acid reductoisomerase
MKNFLAKRKSEQGLQLEKVGKTLRKNMKWIDVKEVG